MDLSPIKLKLNVPSNRSDTFYLNYNSMRPTLTCGGTRTVMNPAVPESVGTELRSERVKLLHGLVKDDGPFEEEREDGGDLRVKSTEVNG